MRETVLVILTAACLGIGIWNLAIAILGRFPRFCGTAVGTLTKAKTRHNVRSRARVYPILTSFTYTYTVNGRQHRHSGIVEKTKRKLPQKVSMVYIKHLPHRAYPEKFTGELEWILAILLLYFGIAFLHGFF